MESNVELTTNLSQTWGSLRGWDPSVDVLDWKNLDTHSGLLTQLAYYLDEAALFRTNVVTAIKRLERYHMNMYLKAADSTSTEAHNQAALKEKQSREKGKGRAVSMAALNGQSERRKALYGAMPLDFECSRMTTCDDDYTIAEFYRDLSNRFLKKQIDAILDTYFDKLTWQFRPILMCEWDPSGGVESEYPKTTDEEFTVYGKAKIRNKPLADGGFWLRNERGTLLTEPPVVTGTPVFSPLGPLEYLIDPAAGWRGLSSARYFATQRVVDASEVFERWANDSTEQGKIVEKLLDTWQWGNSLVLNSAESEIWGYRDMDTSASTMTKAVLTEVFMRPRKHLGLNQGAHGFILTNAGIDNGLQSDGLVLKWEPLKWPHDIPGADDGCEITDSQYYFGDNNNNIGGGLARAMNMTLTAALKNAQRMNRVWGVATGVDMDAAKDGFHTEETGDGNSLTIIPGDQAKLQLMQLGGSAEMAQLRMLDPLMQALSAATNSSPGAVQSNELATIANRGLMYEASVANAVKARAAKAIIKAVTFGARLCQRNLTTLGFKSILNDKDETEILLFKDADLRHNTNIKLRATSFFAGNPELRMSFIAMAAQGGKIFEKYMDSDQMSELLRFRDELGPTTLDAQVERAEWENARLRRGPIRRLTTEGTMEIAPAEGVFPTDDHETHHKIHSKPLSDIHRELLSPEYLKWLTRHDMVHVKSMQMAAQAQMQDAILSERLAATKMAGLGGVPVAAPPAGSGQGPAGQGSVPA